MSCLIRSLSKYYSIKCAFDGCSFRRLSWKSNKTIYISMFALFVEIPKTKPVWYLMFMCKKPPVRTTNGWTKNIYAEIMKEIHMLEIFILTSSVMFSGNSRKKKATHMYTIKSTVQPNKSNNSNKNKCHKNWILCFFIVFIVETHVTFGQIEKETILNY